MSTDQDESPAWKHFEYHCWYLLRRSYPEDDGWEIEYQEKTESGVPDFVVRHDGRDEVIIVDAKDRIDLSGRNIDRLIDYADDLNAGGILLMLAWDTEYSARIRAELSDHGIEVRVTEWRHPGSRCYCYDPDEDEDYCFVS